MKRLIAGGGLLLLLVAGGVFLWQQKQYSLSSTQIAPADCLVFIEVPNLIQTVTRWPDTALNQILAEPSVQRFLRQPVSRIPKNFQSAWRSLGELRCSALFFGMTDPNGKTWVCGFQTDQKVWRREISNISSSLFGQPAQEFVPDQHKKTGSIASEAGKIVGQTYCAKVGSWILLSRSTDLLSDAIRNAKVASGGLQSVKVFQECQSNIPAGYDILCFVRGGPSIDLSSGLSWRFQEEKPGEAARAVLAATAIDGAQLRDTIFALTDAPAPSSPLDRQGLAMTGPTTVGYLATRVNPSEIWRWCDKLSHEWSFAETIRDYMGEVKTFGIDPQDLDKLLSYAEVVVDRDPNADFLKTAFSLRVTDPAKFQHLMDQVVTEKFPDNCRKIEIASVPAYAMQLSGNASIVFGLVGRQLLIAWSEPVFAELVQRLQSHNAGLEDNAQFKAMAKLVAEPADMFVYFDAKAGFESLYNASRPMLVFGVALIPTISKYIDAMALPETAEVSKHLGPIVLSRHRVTHGVIDESVGPITAYEALALVSGGALAMGLLEH
ncbi:MAG: hypothetical protein JOZ21_01725 [Verrucomicrobia bacterium]|nr:hypothetical protein [Verrucomicrobiota bacterium]